MGQGQGARGDFFSIKVPAGMEPNVRRTQTGRSNPIRTEVMQLDHNGSVSASKLGDCGSMLWSAPDSHKYMPKEEKAYTKIEIIVVKVIVALTLLVIGLVLLWRSKNGFPQQRPFNSNSSLMRQNRLF